MRFFNELEKDDVFFIEPMTFSKESEKEQLAYCLGATLYMPATRTNIVQQLVECKFPHVTAIILDLEDSVGLGHVEEAVDNIVQTLKSLEDCQFTAFDRAPLLFIRPRHAQQFAQLVQKIGPYQHVLTGYVFPKFCLTNADAYLHVLEEQRSQGYKLYGMPVLETADFLYKEQRMQQLIAICEKLLTHHEAILNVRIGTTDFAGVYGIRRTIDTSVYDMLVIKDCLTDILNVFNRMNRPFVLSGGVWEYFDSKEHSVQTKTMTSATQGLIKEVQLDKLNGFVGKTIIHPSHIDVVNAIYAVTHEEYLDALNISSQQVDEDGVHKSEYANKMNEVKPHMQWACKTMLRANAYGVLQPGKSFMDLV